MGQTKYNMVKAKIKEWINNGQVMPGDKIYSENELVKMFGVSRHTVRLAIGELVHEGWLIREQGAGTFCSNKLTDCESEDLPSSTGVKNIGVITTYISEYIFPSIIKGIESYLTARGYSLTFACTDNNFEKESQCLQTMLNSNVDGLIIEPTKSSSYNPNINYYLQLEQKNIPYLMINQFYPQLLPPHITLNDEAGGFLATDHLIKLGHEKVIGIFKTDDLQGVYRMQGFIRAFRENEINFFPEMIIDFSTEEKESALSERILNYFKTSEVTPTGIVCYNDQIALMIINTLRTLGLKVPEDVSVVGYDDSYLSKATEIKLTTISHPKMLMGIEAAKWIVAAVDKKHGKNIKKESIVYEPELIVRKSTAPPVKNLVKHS